MFGDVTLNMSMNDEVPKEINSIKSVIAVEFEEYQEFLDYCQLYNVNNVMTEEEWRAQVSGVMRRSGGLPAILGGVARGVGNVLLRNSDKIGVAAGTGGITAAAKIVGSILKDEGINLANDFVLKGTESFSIKDSGNKGGNKGPSPLSNGGTKGNENSILGAYDVNPMALELKPGLLNRTYTNSQNYPINRACYSHLNGFRIEIPGSAAVRFFFDNVLIPWFANSSQAAVSFRVDVRQLSSARLLDYFNALIYAYSILFCNTSIISYASIASNKDRGTHALRAMISADDIDYLNQLKGLLSVMPFPPALANTIFWLYQTFTDGANSQSTYRLMPMGFDSPTDTQFWSVDRFNGTDSKVIVDAIRKINSPENLEVSSILTRVIPSWVGNPIKDSSPVALFSNAFMTLFGNMVRHYFYASTNYTSNIISSEDSENTYFTFDPSLDGLVLGLSGSYVGSAPPYVLRPGLGKPASTVCVSGAGTTFFCSAFSYVYSTTLDEYIWRPSNMTIESAFGRNDVCLVYQNNAYYRMPQNSIFVRGVSATIMEECARDVLAYFMSVNTIVNNRNSGNTWKDFGPKKTNKPKTQTKTDSAKPNSKEE